MDIAAKNRQIANSYYNLGLEKAKVRDLSGAAQCLKKSLHFSKYQTDARNLLGLIYYENGEVADALVQWVISVRSLFTMASSTASTSRLGLKRTGWAENCGGSLRY